MKEFEWAIQRPTKGHVLTVPPSVVSAQSNTSFQEIQTLKNFNEMELGVCKTLSPQAQACKNIIYHATLKSNSVSFRWFEI